MPIEKKKPTMGHAQNPIKIQIPTSIDFIKDLDEKNELLGGSVTHDYRVQRSNVGRILFKMYLSVADEIEASAIHDDESFKLALLEAFRKKTEKE